MCGCLDMSYVLYEGRYHTDITAYPRTKVDYKNARRLLHYTKYAIYMSNSRDVDV